MPPGGGKGRGGGNLSASTYTRVRCTYDTLYTTLTTWLYIHTAARDSDPRAQGAAGHEETLSPVRPCARIAVPAVDSYRLMAWPFPLLLPSSHGSASRERKRPKKKTNLGGRKRANRARQLAT